MMALVRKLLELIRFSHTVFALPFALLAALLAWSHTPFQEVHLAGLLLCMVFARSAAMAFNRLVDRNIDAANPRTAVRHLPAGSLSVRVVTAFTIVCSVGFVLSTALFLPNRWPLYLAVPVLFVLLGYSYAKRWTSYCHYWLSLALMLSPMAAWIAIRGTIEWPPVLLGLVVFFWVGGFDILYACQDADFDRQQALFSLPARLGVNRALRIAMLSHALAVVALTGFWWISGFGMLFLAAIVVVAILLVYEHSIVRPDDLSRVNIAFFRVNAMISLGLLAAAAADLWLHRS